VVVEAGWGLLHPGQRQLTPRRWWPCIKPWAASMHAGDGCAEVRETGKHWYWLSSNAVTKAAERGTGGSLVTHMMLDKGLLMPVPLGRSLNVWMPRPEDMEQPPHVAVLPSQQSL
jgi:hypothetical protein